MRPTDVLMHARDAWLQEPQRALTLTLCPACRTALLDDPESWRMPGKGPLTRIMEHFAIRGFTLRNGAPDQCDLHALLGEDAHV